MSQALDFIWYLGSESNRHEAKPRGILSPHLYTLTLFDVLCVSIILLTIIELFIRLIPRTLY